MTISISTFHGGGATDYLTREIAQAREGYYSKAVAAGEPAGIWYGSGAAAVGLTGEVDNDLLRLIYSEFIDPSDPLAADAATRDQARRLGAGAPNCKSVDELYAARLAKEPLASPKRQAELRREAERFAKTPVAFLDATFSVAKSVSLAAVAFERQANEAREAGDLAAASMWAERLRLVEDAVMAGARASLDHLEKHADFHRVGRQSSGAARWADAHGMIASQFLQHDSRDRDPQIHVHQAILNRSLGADGKWRALDGTAFYREAQAASAIGERVMESILHQTLGIRFELRPDGKAREIVGVTEAQRDQFSKRRKSISGQAAKEIAAFKERHGREPSPYEEAKIYQQTTLATRKGKSHDGETQEERLDRWAREAEASMRGSLADIANSVMANADPERPPAKWSPRQTVLAAIERAHKGRDGLADRGDYLKAISDVLPGHIRIGPERIGPLLNRLADMALDEVIRTTPARDTSNLPAALKRLDGSSEYERPGAARYAKPGTVAAENALRRQAAQGGMARLSCAEVDHQMERLARSGVQLDEYQERAVRGILTSGSAIEILSAPAGTGKSFAMGALTAMWEGAGHRVTGLAASQSATEVLAAEGLSRARNVDSWLGAQRRLEALRAGDDDWQFALGRGDLIVLDEASLTNTESMREVYRYIESAGARLLLCGDPRQLNGVGASGMMYDLTSRTTTHELKDVRRFNADWEKTASLKLRDGEIGAVEEYNKHGRIQEGGTAEQAEEKATRAWLADHLSGKNVLMLVESNEQASRASATIRSRLVELGRVAERGVELRDGNVAAVGDIIEARRNAWELTDPTTGAAPINRFQYTVVDLLAGGGLLVERDGVRLPLPAGYVRNDVQLGYATTVHAAQGRTVDVCHAVLSVRSKLASAYVALTRGRERNTAWVETRAVPKDAETGQALDVDEVPASAVLETIVERGQDGPALTALAEMEKTLEEARSFRTMFDQLTEGVEMALHGRTGRWLDRLTAEGALTESQRLELSDPVASKGLDRLLRRVELAGHSPEQALEYAIRERDLNGVKSATQLVHYRISTRMAGKLTPQVLSASDFIPGGLTEEWRTYLQQLADGADARRAELGARLAEKQPEWLTESLGSVPDDPTDRLDWEAKAGWAGAWRELADHTHETDALGNAPGRALATNFAVWRTAHDALGLSSTAADEAELSEAALRARYRALQREEQWGPDYVADDLREASIELQQCRDNAVLWRKTAESSTGPEVERLLQAASEAEREADELEQRVAELEDQDAVYNAWDEHVSTTRDRGQGSYLEAQRRGVDLDAAPDDLVTAEEFMDAYEASLLVEEQHREITEADIDDNAELDIHHTGMVGREEPVLETDVPDVRDVLEEDPVQRARIAVTELAQRQAAEERAELYEQHQRWVQQDAHQPVQEPAAPTLERI